jgi:recombination protein RecA
MDIRRTESLKEGDSVYGNRARVKIVKNKVAPPFRVAEFDIIFNHGISKEGCILDVGVELGVIKKAGSWFEYNGAKFAQGRESAKEYLKENAKVAAEIEKKARELMKSANSVSPLEVGVEEE